MKKHTVTLLYFLPLCLSAQTKFDNIWLFGSNLGSADLGYGGTQLNFEQSKPEISFFVIPVDIEANASISDSSGNLLFYTNGCMVINREHRLMANGDSINFGGLVYEQNCGFMYPLGYPAHQGVMILPWPDKANQYIMLQLHRPGGLGQGKMNHNLLRTTIDMTLDGGLGAVTEKNTLVFKDTFPGDLLTAARHGNGRDWWVLLPKFNSPHYYAFLVSPQGVSGPYIQENIAAPIESWGWGSQAAFSPNGKKYATLSHTAGLQIFDFDRCTGKLSNFQGTQVEYGNSNASGVAFSPNSRYLYASTGFYLYQFDLKAENFDLGKALIGQYDSFYNPLPTTFYQMMLAPNGKIYMTTSNGTKYLHVIHQPDKQGTACDFEQRGVTLLTTHSFSPPNFPHFRLFDAHDSPCDTLGINGPPPPEDTTPPPPRCAGNIRIYPNPAQHLARIELPDCEGGSLRVFDAMGRWVEDLALAPESVGTELDVSRYVPGIYFLHIRTATGEAVVRGLAVVR